MGISVREKRRPVLSQTAEYALRAVLFLARRGPVARVGVEEIATGIGLPAGYLSKTLQVLARSGVVRSTRGRTGGFELIVAPDELMLMRVIEPFDRERERRHCLLGRATCSDKTACEAHHAWKDTSERIAGFFRDTSVGDLLRTSS